MSCSCAADAKSDIVLRGRKAEEGEEEGGRERAEGRGLGNSRLIRIRLVDFGEID